MDRNLRRLCSGSSHISAEHKHSLTVVKLGKDGRGSAALLAPHNEMLEASSLAFVLRLLSFLLLPSEATSYLSVWMPSSNPLLTVRACLFFTNQYLRISSMLLVHIHI